MPLVQPMVAAYSVVRGVTEFPTGVIYLSSVTNFPRWMAQNVAHALLPVRKLGREFGSFRFAR